MTRFLEMVNDLVRYISGKQGSNHAGRDHMEKNARNCVIARFFRHPKLVALRTGKVVSVSDYAHRSW